MSPKEARIFFVEDDLDYRETTTKTLKKKGGHSVVISAASIREVLDHISELRKLGVQVAILDSDLTGKYVDGFDGLEIAEALRGRYPSIRIVGNSGNGEFRGPCDVDFQKGGNLQLEGQSLADIITKL